MANILLTGFGAFGNTPVNPAEKVVLGLDGQYINNMLIVGCIAPSNFFECIDVVKANIEKVKPSIVVMMGEYGGRALITVERLAQNLNDSVRYGLRDNNQIGLDGQVTEQSGPAAYYTNLPIKAMVKAMREAGIPSDISDAAGTFCCNHLMYGILHYIAVNQLPIRAGWIHLPHLPEVAALPANLGNPSMSLDTAMTGVKVAINAIVDNPQDIKETSFSRLQI